MDMINRDEISSGEISAILSSLKAEARKRFKAEIKGIFGSYVRGKQKEDSDSVISPGYH